MSKFSFQRGLLSVIACSFLALSMHSAEEAPKKNKEYIRYTGTIDVEAYRTLVAQNYADKLAQIAEMLISNPTVQELSKKYNLEQLKKAEQDCKDIVFHESRRAGNACHGAVSEPVARAEYHDAWAKELAAREQMETIKEAIASKGVQETPSHKDEGKSAKEAQEE